MSVGDARGKAVAPIIIRVRRIAKNARTAVDGGRSVAGAVRDAPGNVSSSASPACRVRVPSVSSLVESSGSDSVMADAVFSTKDQAEAACAVDVPEASVSVT